MTNRFDLAYIDCPWNYYGSPTKNAAAGKHYSLMSLEDLKALPVRDLLKPKAMVFMWATGPRLNHAIEVLEAWNLHYRGVAFVWVKTKKDGTIIHGQGVPPTFTKPTTEFVLLGTTKKMGRMISLRKFNTPQVILAPRQKHSEKPEIFRTRIEETLQQPLAKIELFARRQTEGWVTLGNELDGNDIKTSINNLLI